jgi:hypothetical protein
MNAGWRERARANSNGNATQDVERLAIHRGIDADLGLREVKRDAKCSSENRTAPETEENHRYGHGNVFHIRVKLRPGEYGISTGL